MTCSILIPSSQGPFVRLPCPKSMDNEVFGVNEGVGLVSRNVELIPRQNSVFIKGIDKLILICFHGSENKAIINQ